MYEAFFGLRHRPFQPLPRVDSFVPLSPLREPLAALTRCVHQNQGIGVLTAPSGSGKSLICRLLQREFQESRRTIYLSTGRFPTRRALLQAVLFEMKLPYVGLSEQEARLSLLDLLQSAHPPMDRLLLIVDEAHLLNARGLEELRTLTDYEIDGQPRVSLILSGQLELEEMLTEPSMNALNQRVGCHVCIEPLTFDESAQYVRERLRHAGNDGLAIFTPEAIDWICTASEGNPRRINQLSDHCLLLGFAEEERQIGVDLVKAALLDLRELPLHWNMPVDLGAASTTVDERNPLEAYAESVHESDSEGDAVESDQDQDSYGLSPDVARWNDLSNDSSFDECEDSEVGVFEFGASLPGDSEFAHSTERLFHTPEFGLPVEAEREEQAAESLMAWETAPSPEEAVESSPPAQPVSVPSPASAAGWFEELAIDDPYARLDRRDETTASKPAPQRHEISWGLDASTSEELKSEPCSPISAPTCSAPVPQDSMPLVPEALDPIEAHILEMVEEIREDVHRAQAELDQRAHANGHSAPAPRGRSLRQAISWQYDVVEPVESTEPTSESAPEPSTLPLTSSLELSSAVQFASEPVEATATVAEPDSERRYAQLFTRLQRQRRRVEAIMNRERRTTSQSESRAY